MYNRIGSLLVLIDFFFRVTFDFVVFDIFGQAIAAQTFALSIRIRVTLGRRIRPAQLDTHPFPSTTSLEASDM